MTSLLQGISPKLINALIFAVTLFLLSRAWIGWWNAVIAIQQTWVTIKAERARRRAIAAEERKKQQPCADCRGILNAVRFWKLFDAWLCDECSNKRIDTGVANHEASKFAAQKEVVAQTPAARGWRGWLSW
jgi:hypothetical protein